jgi:hypothetical protein
MFKQYSIELSRKTMADWMMKSAKLLEPLYDRLHELIFKQSVIQADEEHSVSLGNEFTLILFKAFCKQDHNANAA